MLWAQVSFFTTDGSFLKSHTSAIPLQIERDDKGASSSKSQTPATDKGGPSSKTQNLAAGIGASSSKGQPSTNVKGESSSKSPTPAVDQGASSSKTQFSPVMMSEEECIICLEARRDTIYLPCGHFCFCHECAVATKQPGKRCPKCRTVVASLNRVFP